MKKHRRGLKIADWYDQREPRPLTASGIDEPQLHGLKTKRLVYTDALYKPSGCLTMVLLLERNAALLFTHIDAPQFTALLIECVQPTSKRPPVTLRRAKNHLPPELTGKAVTGLKHMTCDCPDQHKHALGFLVELDHLVGIAFRADGVYRYEVEPEGLTQ